MLEGTQVSVEQLAALRQPSARGSQKSFARLIGARESQMAGSGLQMRELRAYEPGDDLRHLHWRATARLGEPMTRVFDQENELSWLLVILLTPEMYFGSRHAYKSVRALEAAALLGWSRLDAGDAVGSVVVSPHGQSLSRPARTRNRWLQQLNDWAEHSAPPTGQQELTPTALSELQVELRRLAQPGRPVVIFSDLLPPHDWSGLLQSLSRSAVTLVQLFDPLEEKLPDGGAFPVQGSGRPFWIQGSRKASQRYRSAREHWFVNLRTTLAGQRLQWVSMSTADDPQQNHWLPDSAQSSPPEDGGAEPTDTAQTWEP